MIDVEEIKHRADELVERGLSKPEYRSSAYSTVRVFAAPGTERLLTGGLRRRHAVGRSGAPGAALKKHRDWPRKPLWVLGYSPRRSPRVSDARSAARAMWNHLTIPWFADHALWGTKVRQVADKRRCQRVGAGRISGGIYLADGIVPGLSPLLTEGEFDALIVRQVGEGLVSAVAIGSAAN